MASRPAAILLLVLMLGCSNHVEHSKPQVMECCMVGEGDNGTWYMRCPCTQEEPTSCDRRCWPDNDPECLEWCEDDEWSAVDDNIIKGVVVEGEP